MATSSKESFPRRRIQCLGALAAEMAGNSPSIFVGDVCLRARVLRKKGEDLSHDTLPDARIRGLGTRVDARSRRGFLLALLRGEYGRWTIDLPDHDDGRWLVPHRPADLRREPLKPLI